MKRIILIGRAECGKTTLTQALRGHKLQYQKTQAVNHHDVVIDTPGEYAENRELARALILYSYEADVIALMLSSTEDYSLFSPNIAAGATRPVIGIVTQIDRENARPDLAESWLRLAGCKTVFRVSAFTGEGIEEVLHYLEAEQPHSCKV
ncbi:EutP/PduV family microcompartment system protein [Faecalispora anaeroviscerum]|uniref:EutP/PduV family microcompartment system protein n=1 Tax=Faecalispora anaeroviscerum TaxID=2991836 RepID=UPI0024B88BAF|nr:EutP/PduV family microcompartment system protein [Faecalispora anaeroviscerum]